MRRAAAIDGLHPRLPARREAEPVARLAARPAQPRLDPGLDFLVRGERVLPAHPLPVHPHPGAAHVEDHPEPLNISSGHGSHCRQQQVSRPQDTRPGDFPGGPVPCGVYSRDMSHGSGMPESEAALLALVPAADPLAALST